MACSTRLIFLPVAPLTFPPVGLFQQLLWDVLPTLSSSSPVSSNSISNSNAQSTPGVQHSAQQQQQPDVTEQPIQAAVRWLRRITASRTAPSEPTRVAAPDSPTNPSLTPNTCASTSLAARSPTVLSSTPPSVSGGADVIAVQTLASLLAGVTSAAVTTPLDLVKTRVQVSGWGAEGGGQRGATRLGDACYSPSSMCNLHLHCKVHLTFWPAEQGSQPADFKSCGPHTVAKDGSPALMSRWRARLMARPTPSGRLQARSFVTRG